MRSSRAAVDCRDGRFTLVKHAPTISYGAHADLFLVTARQSLDAAPSDQCLTVVRRADARLDRTAGWDALGMRGTASEAFAFAGEGDAAQILPVAFADIAAQTMVPASHLLWGAAWSGIAIDAVTRARACLRAQSRRSPGAPLPGAVRLARAAGLIETIQARLRILLHTYDAGEPERRLSGLALATTMNLLKQDLSEACHEAVVEALMICGMAGYANDSEFSIGRHLRDICSARIMISNDRIAPTTGALLLAQRADLGAL
jgi:acyl-CoA dehydrogenase